MLRPPLLRDTLNDDNAVRHGVNHGSSANRLRACRLAGRPAAVANAACGATLRALGRISSCAGAAFTRCVAAMVNAPSYSRLANHEGARSAAARTGPAFRPR